MLVDSPMCNIRNSALVANDVFCTRVLQVFVEDTVEAFGLVLVSVDAVFYLLWGVSGELWSLGDCSMPKDPSIVQD